MIGVIADMIDDDAFSYSLFKSLNKISKSTDCYLFPMNFKKAPIRNEFTILQPVNALHHKGTLISTSLLNTQVLANSLQAKKRFFYFNDLDWRGLGAYHAEQLAFVTQTKDINLISRSNSHDKVISKMFKPTAGVVYNWDADQLLKVIE
jgi:hypothetical protein